MVVLLQAGEGGGIPLKCISPFFRATHSQQRTIKVIVRFGCVAGVGQGANL